ncbi:F-box domain-containing protein/DUF295 domain-containing protein [Cephalotus follicularis]|uniref:F-box domain-containing protein/DUF295 domain-containing protein n=1 Tax=Cephalotus follicularis TaxID=3775 RepID=A0A1Q3CTB5_CEPFO|nr:F-box domain-containing protein/DUF295 domain-containing protein [Cephalotus follicularis]
MERKRRLNPCRNAKNLSGVIDEANGRKTNKKQIKNVETKARWTDLPDHLIEVISSRLYARDLCSFRGVCRAWRASAATQCFYDPQLVITYQSKEIDPYLISLTQSKWFNIKMRELDQGYCVGSAYGWLIMRKNNSFKVSLLNLYTKSVLLLPPLTFTLQSAHFYLSSPPTSPDCIVLATGLSLRYYAFCKVGDNKWNKRRYSHPLCNVYDNYCLKQAVALQGKFYALSNEGELVTIEDIDNAQLLFSGSAINGIVPRKFTSMHPFLVEAQGEILVVLLWIILGISRHIELFRMDFRSSSWAKMESLGDRVLFLGYNCSFCVAAGLLNLRGNCIYIANHTMQPWSVYDMETKLFLEHVVDFWPRTEKNNRIWVLPTFK